jgi:uncharacterized repeat protein (TIGR02543 family)
MAKLWKFVPVLVVAVVCLGLTMVPGAPPAKVASAATLNCGFEVQPNMTEVGYNETFTVNATVIDTVAQDMFGWDLYLTFDPVLVEVTGVDTPATLPAPNNAAPELNPAPTPPGGMCPYWNNTTGVVHHGYTRALFTPDLNSSFVFCTIHFRSKAVAGTSYLNFTAKDPAHRADIIDLDGIDCLNWSMVVNGTVRIGSPTLTVNVAPAGKGNVTMNGTLPPAYPNTTNRSWGEVVELNATAALANWVFTSWSGDLTGSTNPTSITMDDSKNVTANFAPLRTLTMAVNGNGTTVPVVGNHTYGSGTVVNISADPDSGWQFVNWNTTNISEIDNPTAASTTVLVDENKTVTANFAEITAAILEGHVAFTGRGAAPDSKWIELFNVTLFEAGNLSHVIWAGNATTNDTGVFTITGLDPGTYDIGIKNWTCLSEVKTNETLTAGNTTVVDFGTTREGDADNNDHVNILDASSLVGAFGSSQGGSGWNAHCDFNREGNVNILDASALASNFGDHGDLT